MNKFKVFSVVFLLIFTAITCIKPLYPNEQFLQHFGTLFIVLVLVFDIRKNIFSNAGFLGIVLFGVIHIIGARYIYSYVPYNDFSKNIFNFDIDTYYHFKRNHFDRVVHFSFGLLILPSVYQYISKKYTNNLLFALLVSWLLIQTFSMIYELFEWSLSIIMSETDAENYNGQQGDVWDAQKDMGLALLGSSITYVVYFFKYKFAKNR